MHKLANPQFFENFGFCHSNRDISSNPSPKFWYTYLPGYAIYLSGKTSDFLIVDLPNRFSNLDNNI